MYLTAVLAMRSTGIQAGSTNEHTSTRTVIQRDCVVLRKTVGDERRLGALGLRITKTRDMRYGRAAANDARASSSRSTIENYI